MAKMLLPLCLLLCVLGCKEKIAQPETPVVKRASWKGFGCELISDLEVAKLFGFNAADVVLNSRSLPDQAFCLRTWQKPDWKERESNNEKEGAVYLNPTNRLVVQLFDYTSDVHATQQMDMLRRDRRSTYEEDVKGLGDDALWSTSTVTLLVKKGQNVVNISLEHLDKPHDNLARAQEIAAIILKKL